MACCFACIPNGTAGAIERCGRFVRIAHPGINLLNPCLCEGVSGLISLRVQQLNVECETKTADSVFVMLHVSVQYQVVRESLYDAFYKLTDYKTQIRAYVYDVVRASVPRINLDDVFLTKEEIAHEVKAELAKAMSGFGFEILNVLVTDIDPAKRVKDSMNAIVEAQRLRQSAYQRAEADKATRVKAAEAEAEAKYLQGQGVARERMAILNGLKESVADFQAAEGADHPEVTNKEIMELLMLTQYFDTLQTIGSRGKGSTIFMQHSPKAVHEIMAQLRDALSVPAVAAGSGAGPAQAPRAAPGMTR